MNRIKVSACIITYNQQDYIKDCLEGAINQVLDFDYEIVIGDDCSTDNTLQICEEYAKKYPNKIRLLSRTANKGMVGNWVDTIQNCQGKYIALCEGDDYWTDDHKLQKQVDFLEQNPDYVLCFHKTSILKNTGEIVDDFITKVPEKYQNVNDILEKGNFIHTPSVVFKNIIDEFPSAFYQSPICDYFLYVMLTQYGKAKYLPDAMAIYRYNVGVFSTFSSIRTREVTLELYICLLSFLSDEEQKKIVFQRCKVALESLRKTSKYHYTTNRYLSKNKSFKDIVKIFIFKVYIVLKR
jgi:glycosyltransferase involved in cell wall biosynthesis